MLCIQLKLSQQMLLSERSCEYFLLIILLIQQELYSQKQKKSAHIVDIVIDIPVH